MIRSLGAFLIAILLVVGFTAGAAAHAMLISAAPADGSVVKVQPASVELHFNEAVVPGAVTLIDAAGRDRREVQITASGDTITVALPGGLPEGSQIVSYHVISRDGHPVAGSVVFSIGSPSATVAPAQRDQLRDMLIWLTRAGLYIGLFAGVGGVVFLCWIADAAAPRKLVLAALGIGSIAGLLSVGLLGLDLLGLPPLRLAAWLPWQVALGTRAAVSLSAAIGAMAAGALALAVSQPVVARTLASFALLGTGLALVLSGHAATAEPARLARTAIFIHGIGVAYWLGALGPLAILVRQSRAATLPALSRFSRAALPMVGGLVLSGLVLAAVELPTAHALVETTYGVILLIKLALVVILLALAALNRMRLVPGLARSAGGADVLGRSIVLECATAIVILAVVAGWRFTPPPRSLIPETPLAVHIHAEKAMFQVLISPGKVGQDDFVLQLMNGDGRPLAAKEATLTLSLPGRGIAALERQATRGADGYWHIRKAPLPLPGRWHLRIDALVSDFDQISLEDDVDIAPPWGHSGAGSPASSTEPPK